LKKLVSLLISAVVEANNFKIGTQLQFGEYVTITTLIPNLVAAGWATGAPKKLLVSRTQYHVPRTLFQLTGTKNVIKLQIGL